jgi:hypothetical protein
MKTYELIKDLPGCPVGRIFKQNISGGYYHSMTDEEMIYGNLKMYDFTKDEVEQNPDWFSEVKLVTYMMVVYEPDTFTKKYIDTGIPKTLVSSIQSSLSDLGDDLISSPVMFDIDTNNIEFRIMERGENETVTKYIVKIQKYGTDREK